MRRDIIQNIMEKIVGSRARSKCKTLRQEPGRQMQGLVGGNWCLVGVEHGEDGRAQGVGRILQVTISNLVNSK